MNTQVLSSSVHSIHQESFYEFEPFNKKMFLLGGHEIWVEQLCVSAIFIFILVNFDAKHA